MAGRIIVMFSGGLDSLTALVELRRCYPDMIVHAHHCQLKTEARRHEPEWQAVCRAVRLIREQEGPIQFSTSVLDFRHIRTNFYDIWPLMLDAGQMCIQAEYAGLAPIMAVATGHRFDLAERAAFANLSRVASEAERIRWRETVQYAYRMQWFGRTPTYRDPQKIPPLIFPVRDKSRAECREVLGDLYPVAWSCRAPVIANGWYRECGKCLTCEYYKSGDVPSPGDRLIDAAERRGLSKIPQPPQ